RGARDRPGSPNIHRPRRRPGGSETALRKMARKPEEGGSPAYTAPSRHGHEADLPAQEAQARTHPRLPRAHADARWSGDPQAAPRQGSQATRGLGVVARDGAAKRGRLSRSAEFERVYRQGRSVANRHLVLYSFPTGTGGDPRVGLSVSRRVGGA